jgi:xanthine dehydrogenase/oxidase
MKDAIRHKSYFDGFGTNLKVGDCDTVLESCPHSLGDEVKLGGQAHFYMEPQVAIAMPKGEDGEMEIVAAIQNPADTQVLYMNNQYLMRHL